MSSISYAAHTTAENPEEQATEAAERYDEQRRAFHVHATVFVAVIVLIFAVNLLTNLTAGIAGELSAWWSVWALIGWGSGIAVHGLVVRLAQP